MSCNGRNEKILVILLVILLISAITNAAPPPPTPLTLQEVHLVRCLTYISQSYFTSGRYLLISSPAAYRDVQQELIAEIQQTANWPVVVSVDGNIIIPEKRDFLDRDGSYIILIPDGTYESFEAEVSGLVLGRGKFNNFWNSESRFVVAGTNEFSTWLQTTIFHYLSQLRIYNCIIVSQEHHVKDKEYSRPINGNDIDTGMKLGVYTWFPYQSSDRCNEVNDITLLDSWVISAQGHFTKNTDLFPRKASNSLNGCPLKTIVRNGHSEFTTKYLNHTYSNGSVVRYIEGLEIDLLRVILKQINMTFFHVPTSESFEIDHGPFNNFVRSMIAKKAFIALGDVGNRHLSSILDFTNTYKFDSIRWYVPCSVKYPRWSSIFRIMSVELWLFLIMSMVIAAISTTLVGRYSCTSEWQLYKTLTSSLTNFWAVILGVAVSTMPRTPSLRSLFLAWVCFSLAFSTVFQAFLTTFLTDSGYITPIQNKDELFASGIKLAYSQGYDEFFKIGDETEALKVYSNRVNCPSKNICFNWATHQKNVSVLMSDIAAEIYYTSGDSVGENSESLLCSLEDGAVFNARLTMLMIHADPLMSRVTEVIDRVVEAGIYNLWFSLRMHSLKLRSRKIAIVDRLGGYYSFNLYHMQPAFYLLLMGLCLGALCFMVEMFYNRVLNKRNRSLLCV